jgi:hypothetical protein
VQPPPSEAMIFVHDNIGTRVVAVPTVLVGAERIVAAPAASAAGDASVAF